MKLVEWGNDPITVDRQLRAFASRLSRASYQLCVGLHRASELRAHNVAGFGSFREYAEHLFGCSGRETEDRLRLAERLESLPELRDSFARGEITYSKARELSRITTQETEHEWLAAAEGRTAREVEQLVSGREVGELPDGPSRPQAQVHRVTMTLSPTAYALLQDARTALIRETGGSIDDEQLVAEMARRLLGKPDDGHSGYRIAITTCDRCRHTTQSAGGQEITIDESALALAQCDAQHVGRVDVDNPPRATETNPPRKRRSVLARHKHRCAVPGCQGRVFIHIHHMDLRSEGGTHDLERMIPLCATHHAMVHDGRVIIDGTWSTEFTFKHADGTTYGSPRVNGARVDALAHVFSLLCGMGYKSKEARAIADAVADVDLPVPELLHEALKRAPSSSGASFVREHIAEYVRAA